MLEIRGFHRTVMIRNRYMLRIMKSNTEELKLTELTVRHRPQPRNQFSQTGTSSLIGPNAHMEASSQNHPRSVPKPPPSTLSVHLNGRPNPDRRPRRDVRPNWAKLPPPPASSGLGRFPRPTTSSGRKLGSHRRRLFGSGLRHPP